MAPSVSRQHIVLPVAVGLLGIAFFSTMDAVMKGLSITLGAYNAMLWRVIIGVPLTGLLYAAWRLRGRLPPPSRAAMRLHLIRGIVSAGMAVAFFWGLVRMPLAEAIALSFIAPLIALYLAALLLGEKIGRRAIAASVLGLAGMLLILSAKASGPAEQSDWAAVLAILGSAVLYAYNIVLMRQQAQVAGPLEVAFFQNLTVAAVLGLVAPLLAAIPPAGELPGLAAAALLASASLLLLAWAYRRAEAQRLVPVEYSALIWAALYGSIFFDEQVQLATMAGAALIVGGCVIAARTQREPVSPAEAAV
ncbi:MAG: family transporter [Alphaproteobacteria bacterium]|nr:family transporter [Alphaproteobacteria bacterium]